MPARTALASRSPGQPCSRLGRTAHEALRAEGVRVGVQIGVMMHKVGAAEQLGWRTVSEASDLNRRDHLTWDGEQERGPVSQGLLHRRDEKCILVSTVNLLYQTTLYVTVMRE